MKFYQSYEKWLKTKDITPLWVYTVSAKKYNNLQRMMSYRKQYIPFRAALQLL